MFTPEKKPHTREDMIEYISSHFKKDYGIGWDVKGFANNVKVHHLNLPKRLSDSAYQMIDFEEFHDDIKWLLDEFYDAHNGWSVSFAGRSSGYLVLVNRSNPGYYRDFDKDSISELDMVELMVMNDVLYNFDKMCDDARDALICWCENYDVVEETVMVPKKVLKLVEKTFHEQT